MKNSFFLLLALALMTTSCATYMNYNQNGELINSFRVKANSPDTLLWVKGKTFLNGELYDGILYRTIKSLGKSPDRIDIASFTPNKNYNGFSHVGTVIGVSHEHEEDSIFKMKGFYKLTFKRGMLTEKITYNGEKIRVDSFPPKKPLAYFLLLF